MNPSGELPQNVVRKVVTTKRSTTRMERPPTASCGPQRGCARQNLPAEANPAVQRLPPGMSYPGRAQGITQFLMLYYYKHSYSLQNK